MSARDVVVLVAGEPTLVSLGAPFLTGGECPGCGFDCVLAYITIIGVKPKVGWLCGRRCGFSRRPR